MVPNLGILFSRKILQLNIFDGANFKHDNIIFKFQHKNTQISHFWSQIQTFLFFREIFQLGKFKGADFKYNNSVFKFQPKNPNKAFLVANLRFFYFCSKLCVLKHPRLLQILTIAFFQISAQKYPNMALLVLNLRSAISFS